VTPSFLQLLQGLNLSHLTLHSRQSSQLSCGILSVCREALVAIFYNEVGVAVNMKLKNKTTHIER